MRWPRPPRLAPGAAFALATALGLASAFPLATACAPSGRAPQAAAQGAPPAAPAKKFREAAAAGHFYPDEPGALAREVQGFLGRATRVAEGQVTMVLVPHAGLQFSGQVAADAFKQLTPGFDRVVIVAANHTSGAHYDGLAVDGVSGSPTHYRVPGLEVPIAPAALGLRGKPGFVNAPAVHGMHMVEIELPFLQQVNGRPFALLPIVAGGLDLAGVGAAAAELATLATPTTRFVFSVDLSHGQPYDEAVRRDRACLDALSRADVAGVIECDTDGTQVLLLMNALAARLAFTPRQITYANSGDTGGDRRRVVGYGALIYEDRLTLTADEGGALVKLARAAVEARVREARPPAVPQSLLVRWPRLGARRGAFVTLRQRGQLRGCIGTLDPHRPLADDVVANAVAAAVKDPRFPPVGAGELAAIDLSISVLEAPRALEGLAEPAALLDRLGQTRPGLIIELGGRRSTFLPEVWEELPQPGAFLAGLCAKQGAPPDCWRDARARLLAYGSQHFSER